jgi:hypothetical protein
VTVSWFVLKTNWAMVCRLRSKSMGGCDGMGHVSRSSGLLRVEASWTRVFQSDFKTGGDAVMGGACGIIVEVASSTS